MTQHLAEKPYWNLSLSELRRLALKAEPEKQEFYERQLRQFTAISQEPPIEASPIYQHFHKLVSQTVCSLANHHAAIREQEGLYEQGFEEPLELPEEVNKQRDEQNKRVQEWIKKSKKKWGEAEAKQAKEMIGNKVVERLNKELAEGIRSIIEASEALELQTQIKENRVGLTHQQVSGTPLIAELQRKNLFAEMDIEGRRIMIRAHLKLSSEPNAAERKSAHEQRIIQQLQEAKLQEEQKQQAHKDDKKQSRKVTPPLNKRRPRRAKRRTRRRRSRCLPARQ